MFRLALASIRSVLTDAELVCVILGEHQDQFSLADILRDAEPRVRIATVPQVTGGALETCLAAEPLVTARSNGLIVLDCDLTFSAANYFLTMSRMDAGTDDSAGLLLSFRSRMTQFSYAACEGDLVIRTAEKQAISDRALTGAYGFGQAACFFAAARHIVEQNILTGNGEYYVSSVYNHLIDSGGKVMISDADRIWSIGTPEELHVAMQDPAFLLHLQSIGLNPHCS
jgi:dTDP-glucose pyrophosphorylase